MPKEDDILREAIIGTEREIFGDAFGQEDTTLDETGDRSLEAMGDGLEGQVEPNDDEDEPEETDEEEGEGEGEDGKPANKKAAAEGEEELEPEAKADDKQDDQRGRVPPGRLREQTEARRAAEAERDTLKAQLAERDTAYRQALAETNARVEGLMAALRGQQPKPAEQARPEAPPDLFENPQAYAEYVERKAEARVAAFQQQMRDQHINASMEGAKARHGEAFDQAFSALTNLDARNPDNKAFVQRLISAPNPGEAVVAWHKRNTVLRQIGNDPDAYQRRIAEDARKAEREALMNDENFKRSLIEGMRTDASTGNNGQPRNHVRLPPSLARTSGSNTRAPNDLEIYDGSERATFDSAWN